MSLTNKKDMGSQKGFTIVELLIVVVIIGILAAIVVVAYNGLTNRAKTSKTQTIASTLIKKAEAYNSSTGNYPDTFSDLTGAAPTELHYVDPNAYVLDAADTVLMTSAIANGTNGDNTFNFSTCNTPPTAPAFGVRISVWDYSTNTLVHSYAGGANGTSNCTVIQS